MIFNVPQFIDVEDKIVGPLTWRQLLWMIGLGALLLLLFNMLSRGAFLVIAVPIIMLFVALAFYRPNNQPLIVYLMYGLLFLFRPKVVVWERPMIKRRAAKPEEKKEEPVVMKARPLALDQVRNLARIVDQRGRV